MKCPKCGFDPTADGDEFVFNFVHSEDKVHIACIRCTYSWLEEPKELETPPEGLDI